MAHWNREVQHGTSRKGGLIIGIKKLEFCGSDLKIVEFLPSDLTGDLDIVIKLASSKGYLDVDDVKSETWWSEYRISRAFKILEEKKICRKTTSYI
ncbi:MAG: hypothetical protein ACTSU9_03685 [Promethearchaeota archaeon]